MRSILYISLKALFSLYLTNFEKVCFYFHIVPYILKFLLKFLIWPMCYLEMHCLLCIYFGIFQLSSYWFLVEGFWKEIILKFPWIWERATCYWAEYNIFFTTPVIFINDKCCNVLRHTRDFRAIFVCVVPSDCQKNTDSRAPPQIYWIKTSGLRARSHLSFRITALGYGWAFDPVLYS